MFELVMQFLIRNKVFTIALIFAIVLSINYLFTGRKAYCMIRIRERIGNGFITHEKSYKGFSRFVVNKDTGKKIVWLSIGGLKKVWKLPTADDFLQVKGKNRLLELAWYGGNKFRAIKISNHVYLKAKDQTKRYVKKPANKVSLRILPEDLKYVDYECDTNIDRLSANTNWFEKYFKPHMSLIITGVIVFLMVYTCTKMIMAELGEQRSETKNWMDNVINFAKDKMNTEVDSKTAKSPNPPDGGG